MRGGNYMNETGMKVRYIGQDLVGIRTGKIYYLSWLEKGSFETERTKELRKAIEETLPRELFVRIEPLLNELVDLSMERAFLAGSKRCKE